MPPKQTPKGGSPETRRRLNKKRCLKPLITKFPNLEDQPKFPFGPHKTIHEYISQLPKKLCLTTLGIWEGKHWHYNVSEGGVLMKRHHSQDMNRAFRGNSLSEWNHIHDSPYPSSVLARTVESHLRMVLSVLFPFNKWPFLKHFEMTVQSMHRNHPNPPQANAVVLVACPDDLASDLQCLLSAPIDFP